ncbi:MAG TPA: hypothetical protein VHX88_00290 [Solirubrobacteraceae bacterium]|jgi:hypothetical protein|nr:hypothetical protein [Solirubrobacteraceae bacterium]
MGAVLAVTNGTLSHRAAAWLWKLPPTLRLPVDVIAPTQTYFSE